MPRTNKKKRLKKIKKASSQAAKKNPTRKNKNDTAEEEKLVDEFPMLCPDHCFDFNPSFPCCQEKLDDGLDWEMKQNYDDDDKEEEAMLMHVFDLACQPLYDQKSTKTGHHDVRARVWVDFPIIGIWYVSSTPLF